MIYVVDASVVVKLATDEPASDAVAAWMYANAGEPMWAPAVLVGELGRALQKKGKSAPASMAQLHAKLLQPFDLASTPLPDLSGWNVARTLTYYDAQYVALAQRLGATLVTADKPMAERARAAGLAVLEFG